MTQQLLQI